MYYDVFGKFPSIPEFPHKVFIFVAKLSIFVVLIGVVFNGCLT